MARPQWAAHDDAWWGRVASAIAGVVAVVGVVSALDDDSAPVLIVAVASAVSVAGFLVASRRRIPTPLLFAWTAVPAIALNVWTDTEALMFLVVVSVSYCALVETRPQVRHGIGVAGIASPVLIELLSPHDWGWPFWTLGIAFSYLSSLQLRQFRLLVVELEATRNQLAEQAVNDERRRIAAELHDLVGHSLTVVLLHLSAARRRLRKRGVPIDPETDADLAAAEAIGRDSLAEIRQNIVALRGDRAGLQPLPSAKDVRDLIGRSMAAGSVVNLTVTGGELDTIEPMTGLAVFRVVQESLANAARHAPGAASTVTIDVSPTNVCVEVRDIDFRADVAPATNAAGIGLVGMRERIESLGGEFAAGPTTDGWSVRARLPRTRLGPNGDAP
jgi:signal transduction histidine kinase